MSFNEVPADVDDWQNPIPQLLLNHVDKFEAMDLLASRHDSEEWEPPPTEMLGQLADIDVVAIGRSAIRLYNTSQHHYRSIIDDRFDELMEHHWTGNLADVFRGYMEGDNGNGGVEEYLRQVKLVSEWQALAFLNMAEDIKAEIEAMVPGLEDLFSKVDKWVAMDEEATTTKQVVDQLLGQFLARFHPVIAGIAQCVSWVLETYFRVGKSVEGSRQFLVDYDRRIDAEGNAIPNLMEVPW
ncbi:hypothetical protein GCM10029992_19600 [Glycomyces albus]